MDNSSSIVTTLIDGSLGETPLTPSPPLKVARGKVLMGVVMTGVMSTTFVMRQLSIKEFWAILVTVFFLEAGELFLLLTKSMPFVVLASLTRTRYSTASLH